jgi:hypothetical protein
MSREETLERIRKLASRRLANVDSMRRSISQRIPVDFPFERRMYEGRHPVNIHLSVDTDTSSSSSSSSSDDYEEDYDDYEEDYDDDDEDDYEEEEKYMGHHSSGSGSVSRMRLVRHVPFENSSSDSDDEPIRPRRIQIIRSRRPREVSSSSDDSLPRRIYMGNRMNDFPRRESSLFPREESVEDEKKVNVEIHREVLSSLEEMANEGDKDGIKRLAAQINGSLMALEHTKQYPSMYKKALGDHYAMFERYMK